MRTLRRAALANNIVFFFGTLVVAALIYAVLDEPVSMLSSSAATHTSTEYAAEGQLYMSQAWDLAPIIILLIGALQLIAAATLEARLP